MTYRGEKAWTRETGLPSIWILGMFPPTPATTIVIPLNPESDAKPNTNCIAKKVLGVSLDEIENALP